MSGVGAMLAWSIAALSLSVWNGRRPSSRAAVGAFAFALVGIAWAVLTRRVWEVDVRRAAWVIDAARGRWVERAHAWLVASFALLAACGARATGSAPLRAWWWGAPAVLAVAAVLALGVSR